MQYVLLMIIGYYCLCYINFQFLLHQLYCVGFAEKTYICHALLRKSEFFIYFD